MSQRTQRRFHAVAFVVANTAFLATATGCDDAESPSAALGGSAGSGGSATNAGAAGQTAGNAGQGGQITQTGKPSWFPDLVEPEENPSTPEKIELGRHLFYDKRLSENQTQSCASCHKQEKAFTDGRATGLGSTGQSHIRGAMSLANIGYASVLTWGNPLILDLEYQALVPLFGENPVELGMVGKEDELVARIKDEPKYQTMFPEAFPDIEDPFTIKQITQAIASFERSIFSGRSPYDLHSQGLDAPEYSESAARGEALFFSERLECYHCHSGFTFSDSVQAANKPFAERFFHNTGLYNIGGDGSYPHGNRGVYEISMKEADMGKFRVPTLRNIALTAPYMHDGSMKTLDEVIDHYEAGGRTISSGQYAGDGSKNPYKSSLVLGFKLTAQEREDLKTFLESLTDQTLLTDPAYSDPWASE